MSMAAHVFQVGQIGKSEIAEHNAREEFAKHRRLFDTGSPGGPQISPQRG